MKKELLKIQQSLLVPKGQKNNFGGYAYRSCEDILMKLKPLLAENKCVINMDEDIVAVGANEYVKATVFLYRENGEQIAQTSAFARLDKDKKGMDAPQLSGAALSYARKYALAGLFGIDNEKDNDTNEYQKKMREQQTEVSEDYQEAIMNVRMELERVQSKEDLVKIWNDNKELQKIDSFKQMFTIAKQKFAK